MEILEVDLVDYQKLNEIAIGETLDGTVLDIDKLVQPGDDVDMVLEFYRNVNLTNKF